MVRRLARTLMLAWLVTLLAYTPALAAKSYYAERFDVQLELQNDGSAIVTETVEFHFSGDPFTYAFREIAATETDGITFMDASMDSVPMPQGVQAGQVEVKGSDPVEVRWHFAPTSETSHIFTLRYRAAGVIRKGEADTIIWRAVPENHDYRIMRSTITLIYPSATAPLETPSLSRVYQPASADGRVVLVSNGLAEDEDLVLTARFARDSLSASVPAWQARQEQRRAAQSRTLPIGFAASIASIVLGGLGLLALIRAGRRDMNISPVVPSAIPPSDIPPMLAAKLTGNQQNLMGMIFDLAQKGALELREDKGFLGFSHHMLILKDPSRALKPYEQALLEALFPRGKSEIQLGNIGDHLEAARTAINEGLDAELLRNGWIDPERVQRQTRLQMAGLLALLLAPALLIAGLVGYGASLNGDGRLLPAFAILAGLGAGALIPALGLMIYAVSYSRLTPMGEEQASRWKGFAEYLKQVSKGQEPATRADYFERYLAYAVVFGLGTRWAKYFQDFGGVPLPAWFHAAAGSDGSFAAIVAAISAGDSSSAGASGGGAGASGGGSSGAG